MIFLYTAGALIIILSISICFDIWRKWTKLNRADKSPLNINTFDGLHSPYHPSVLFFENGWNGWRYWMAETPYSLRTKPYGDRNECPSIHVSNNGIDWQEVPGLSNPLEDLSERQVQELDYFSDPCLVMGPNGRLECWYRLTERRGEKEFRTKVSIRRRYSYNGKDWSPVEIMSQLDENTPDKGLGTVVVSPAILYDTEKGYIMWYVNMETAGCPDYQGVSMSISKDGYKWSDAVEIKFNRHVHQWHIDVQLINNKYLMTIFNFSDISIWYSEDGVSFNYLSTPIIPNNKPFSILSNLYKSCLIKDCSGYKLYLGSNDGVDTYVSLMQGSTIENLNQLLTDNIRISHFLSRYYYHQKRRIKFIIQHQILNKLNINKTA